MFIEYSVILGVGTLTDFQILVGDVHMGVSGWNGASFSLNGVSVAHQSSHSIL